MMKTPWKNKRAGKPLSRCYTLRIRDENNK
jgi:hypothetical protein